MNKQDQNSLNNEWPSLSSQNNNNDDNKNDDEKSDDNLTIRNTDIITTNTTMNDDDNKDLHQFIEPYNTFKPIKNDNDEILSPLKQDNNDKNNSQMSNASTLYQPNDLQSTSSSLSVPIPDDNNDKNKNNDDNDDDEENDDEKLDPNNLPETVTILKTDDNKIIYLVGTSHFSKPSHRDVRRVIRTFQPKMVVLELCRSRMCFLSMSEKEIMNEAKSLNFRKIRDYMKKNGLLQTFIYTLLLSASARVTKDLNMAPGGEFRNAFKEASKIPECMITLGDRPIDITLRRAIATLTLWQKVKIAFHCLFQTEKLKAEELERYKKKDVLEQLVDEFSTEFPGLSRVMVYERDLFLINSLKNAAHSTKNNIVVGVVGIGHVAGIRDKWNIEHIDVDELIKIPSRKPSKTSIIIKYTFYGAITYGIYRLIIPNTVKNWTENILKQSFNRIF